MSRLYGFAYTAQSLAYLKTIPKKFRQQIVEKINALASNPHPGNCKVVQSMKGEEGPVLRIRSGDYRILYIVRDVDIVILDIGHRKDVYR